MGAGFEDEVWWSRLAQPGLHAWAEENQPLRLQELTAPKDDPDPKPLSCYGLSVLSFDATISSSPTEKPTLPLPTP
jgi:hypothetical protein